MKNVLQLSQSDQTREKDVKVFNHKSFGKLQIITIEGKEWFPATDVAKKLGYKDPHKAINLHTKQKGWANHPVLSNGGKQNKKFIDEGNLYRLISNSKLPQAEQFEEWVFDEVIPKIRRNGYYMPQATANEIMNNPEILLMIAEQVAQINQNNTHNHIQTNFKLETIDRKIEGEYVTPQDLDAIKFATKVRAEKLISETGVQMTIDTISFGDIYEQARANKLAKEKYKYDVGRLKSKIMVAVKKHLKMKGNAPNNHIKRKDVDTCIEFIKKYRNN